VTSERAKPKNTRSLRFRRAAKKRSLRRSLQHRGARTPAKRRSFFGRWVPKLRWRRRTRIAGLVAGGALLGFLLCAVIGYRWFIHRPGPPGVAVAVGWPAGLDAREAAGLLSDLGLTDAPRAMEMFLRATRATECFVAGPHFLPRGATPQELVAALCRSDDRAQVKLVIPEGLHRYAIAERLAAKGITSAEAFVHASSDRALLTRLDVELGAAGEAESAEGYLFPATYTLRIDTDPNAVVELLVSEHHRRWSKLVADHADGWRRLHEDLGFSHHKALILASMVEKEAVVDDERPIIASVFFNRLGDPAFPKLQSDPTSIYGCFALPERIAACRTFNGRPTPELNRDPANVYSTYVIDGLPPGPIANPGELSIAAVLAPADTGYRYFVAKGQGRHEFSNDYDAHTAAVKRLRDATDP
jgi:UPF0755 protein